jgi:hypothetical protein
MASCEVTTHPFVQGNLPTMSHISQEQFEEIPWQKVKGKYWKRNGKTKSSYSAPTTQQPSPTIFILKTRSRCFNCLAKGYQVASCKDPPICWRCEGSSHVSYQCSRKVIERRQRSLKKQTDDEAGSFSDVIHIIPQEHSTTMQQIEAWLGAVDRSRKTTPLFQLENIESDGTTISSLDAHSLESVSLRFAMKKLEPTNVSTEMRTWR